ncbi:MAG: hypothetical protein KDJ17_00315, partial [Hyphomicrobiaceae bacterium]|nr:hypothetical protein [Hyphomicrobiaceae bacterium]
HQTGSTPTPARRELDRHAGVHLSEEEATFLGDQVAAIETGDEVETLRRRYVASGDLADLRMLVALARARHNDALLAEFAPKLARITRRHEDFDLALKASYVVQCDDQAVGLCDEMPELTALDQEYAAIKAWALFRLGRIVEASGLARELVSSRNQQSDSELAINCAIETGDWNYLQTVVAKALDRTAILSPTDAMRMARLGLECGSPYVDQFRDAALAKAPDDPEINIAAYSLATDRGEEARGILAQQWFERAIAHSSADGPVKQLAIHDLVDHASGWRQRAEHIDKMLRTGEAPLFVAARASGRRLLDLTLGQAQRNHGRRDGRVNVPVFSFSGGKSGALLAQSANVAIDVTALATLHDVGHLGKVLTFFDRIVLAPGTLRLLFTERQFLRVRQPSQVAKARRIQDLIAAGKLKIAKASRDCNPGDKQEFGLELAELFAEARGTGGVVVRSAPISKVGSYLEESADVAAHAAELTDTHAILACLAENGMIDKTRREAAEHYLQRVDQGWDAAPAVEKSSVLYLDELTVTYLDFVDLLEPLTTAVASVFVHQDVERDVRATLQHASDAEGMLTSIEQIREIVDAAVTRGRVVFCRRHRDDDGVDADERADMGPSPTLDILSDLHGVDAAIADDRCLNKENNWTDQHGHVALSATSLDILSALCAAGRISEEEFWQARDHLRRGGYYGVPLAAEEVSYHLKDAHVRDGAIVETPELAAIRESIAQPLLAGAFIPREVVWLASIQFELCKAIRAIWASDLSESAARARADWLVRLLPDPRGWRVNADDEINCLLGQRQLATRAAVLMVFTSGTRARQRQYASWLDETLTGPLREDHPEIWDAALEVLKSYLDQLWGSEPPLPQARGDLFAAALIDPLPPAARMKLLLDSAFCTKHEISPQFWCPLTGGVSAEIHSLHNALRAAIARRKRAPLNLNGGRQTRVNVGRGKNGSATVDFGGELLLFLDADLLSVERRTRMNALRRALGARPLKPERETHWRSVVQERALTDREYAELMMVLGETPEAFKNELKKPQGLNGTILAPNAPSLYECLVPRLDTSTDLQSFIENEFRQARASILARNAVIGLRRMAYIALWRPLIPFELLAAISSKSLSAILAAEDPFSLLFGFEVCAARAPSDPSFVDLGHAFLEKLFADSAAYDRRCEMFSAAALVAMTRMRCAAKASQAPVFWLRLTALAHAGVITDAASKNMDANGFLNWACRNFLPQYTWHGVVDRRAAPRWRPEWISPEHLVAELLGRAQGALHLLPATERPASWVSVIDDVAKRLLEAGRLVASIFPGPLDDFSDQPSALGEMFQDVERSLDDATGLSDVPGLVALAYASRPSEQVTENVLRMLKAGAQRVVGDRKREIGELRIATHVALAARSDAIAEAVIARCYTLVGEAESEDMATAIFLVMVEACAVYGSGPRYTERLESLAAGICFAVDDRNSLSQLLAIFEVLGHRDAALVPALSRACAIAETKVGRRSSRHP